MDAFHYRGDELYVEDVPVRRLAEQHGTPLYVYSRRHFQEQFRRLSDALRACAPLLCYSVKANSNAAVIRTFLDAGAGLDIVSGGELYRARRIGADPGKIVFAGVGKTEAEIEYAIREQILFFTVESEPEAERISACAARVGQEARICFRINPDVDPQTHKYISTGKKENKFGLDLDRVRAATARAAKLPALRIVGMHMHIGSQILSPAPFAEAMARVCDFCAECREAYPDFRYIDIGGGIGIRYKPDQEPLDPALFAQAVVPSLQKLGLRVVMEPGRYLVGNGGIVLGRVQYVKDSHFKRFVIADIGMNDLIRPSLYQAHHEVLAARLCEETAFGDLVGPICESGDFVAADRELPALKAGDLFAVTSAGAYGFAMASNYNSRPRPAEVLVDGDGARVVRDRETWEDLVRGEHMPE